MRCLCEDSISEVAVVSHKCIKDVWFFKELESENLAAFAGAGKQKVFRRHEAVFHQGDPADSRFLIKSGRIKLSKIFADGREVTLDYRKAGDIFGENMLSTEINYPVTRIQYLSVPCPKEIFKIVAFVKFLDM